MRRVAGLLLLAAFPVLVLAADDKPKAKNIIVGKWKSAKGEVFEFKADGSMTAALGEKRSVSGKYKFTADDSLQVEGTLALRVGATIGDRDKKVPYKRTFKITEVKSKDDLAIQDGTLIRKLRREK